ncbi:hypothetical protein [Bordetella pertussis]|uniref:hypothetical protein n=1 Tax=Bordetella pertussis TaxID=520 RepID=UPI0039EE3094
MNWGGGDFQFLKSGSDEPCIQPIESSQLGRGDRATPYVKFTNRCDAGAMDAASGARRRGQFVKHRRGARILTQPRAGHVIASSAREHRRLQWET